MPSLREIGPIERLDSSHTFAVALPEVGVVDPDLRVAVFDGGIAESSSLTPWTQRYELPVAGPATKDYTDHGHAVTSALLFGPIAEGTPVPTPYAKVDHHRALGAQSGKSGLDLFDTLKGIQDVLQSHSYEFVTLSIGPYLPIDDDDVHSWTAVLDEHLASGTVLATLAVGNNGDKDRPSGNARIQVPSDSVNGLAVGAANSPGKPWKRASYSAIGPGRSPGFVKPDLVCYGGSANEPFFVANPTNAAGAIGGKGTSLATPSCMRLALGVRAHFGSRISPLGLKALLVHGCEDLPGADRTETGWGRVPSTIDELVICRDDSTRVIYQGELTAASYVRAKLPLPPGGLPGNVEIAATFCFATETDPEDPSNYTRSGLEVFFRPHADKFKTDLSENPKTRTFFSAGRWASEAELRTDAQKWENTLNERQTMRGSSLKDPVFDIHYNARSGGSLNRAAPAIKFALVVTVRAGQVSNLYNQVRTAFATQLEPLEPVIEIPITTTI